MSSLDAFQGPNAGYVLELYEHYQRDPTSVDAEARALFEQLERAGGSVERMLAPDLPAAPSPAAAPTRTALTASVASVEGDLSKVVGAARLARGIREYGHLAARIDPLGAPRPGDAMLELATHHLTEADLAALPASIVWPTVANGEHNCLEAIAQLREIYMGPLGYDFDHVQDYEQRAWLIATIEASTYRAPLPAEERRGLLERLTEVEEFERFLHTTFQGQKRFSIEGLDLLVPMLDSLIADAVADGTREVLMGMAHRGRLNVLAHILRKPYATIFSEFHSAPNKELVPSEGSAGINYGWTGDVKYHLGAKRVIRESEQVAVRLTLAHNASHLEFVNPVVEGFARAAQDDRKHPGAPWQETMRALAVLVHGDAAFPGEGIVAETLNLSRLAGYQTGGTVHVIANNQIGFTTGAAEGRSTHYASDLAKGFEMPIVHVNADDPEACLTAIRLAHAYRARFHHDFVIDLIGYRRWGHNEGDEPSFTQPRMYATITDHPTVRALYAQELTRDGVVSEREVEQMRQRARERLTAAYEDVKAGRVHPPAETLHDAPPLDRVETAVPAETLRTLNAALLARPAGFSPHPRLERLLRRREAAIDQEHGIEWALAESLAFASILADGTPIRLSGQDAERGTFSQRHLVLHDAETGATFTPLQALPRACASFAVYNSPLSEASVLGFEYGYSVHAPDALVLWEAQFGDFLNAGQVLMDQFIAAARSKWKQHPSLILLLPHGYEGQGPEHSSGRVERFLQLAAEDNLRIANCTTAAQYFHLLRTHAALLTHAPRPLVVMTPKSLLRHPAAMSSLAELSTGRFHPVLDDPRVAGRRERVRRLVLCSGKVAVDLEKEAAAGDEAPDWLAIARVELLYPFPAVALRELLAGYPGLCEVVWAQEEPRNMGAWTYMEPRLREVLLPDLSLRYAGRPEHASTAAGMPEAHLAEQNRLIEEALAVGRVAEMQAVGGQDVG
jgi:2-oxoglutarate dehydrogenase E1 component